MMIADRFSTDKRSLALPPPLLHRAACRGRALARLASKSPSPPKAELSWKTPVSPTRREQRAGSPPARRSRPARPPTWATTCSSSSVPLSLAGRRCTVPPEPGKTPRTRSTSLARCLAAAQAGQDQPKLKVAISLVLWLKARPMHVKFTWDFCFGSLWSSIHPKRRKWRHFCFECTI